MTATLQRENTSVSQVVKATVRVYARRHEPVVESWLAEMAGVPVTDALGFLSCVAAIDRRIVEIVLAPSAGLAGLASAIWHLAASGWRVVILAPAPRMGDAHIALRGTPCTLQPWWIEGEGVAFGELELT